MALATCDYPLEFRFDYGGVEPERISRSPEHTNPSDVHCGYCLEFMLSHPLAKKGRTRKGRKLKQGKEKKEKRKENQEKRKGRENRAKEIE